MGTLAVLRSGEAVETSPAWPILVGMLAATPARGHGESIPASTPCRAPVAIGLQGAPDASTLQGAVQWVMRAVASSDRLSCHVYRLPSPGYVCLADSSWDGAGPVPCSVADAVVRGAWSAPGQELPGGWPPPRPVRVELGAKAPDTFVILDSTRDLIKYASTAEHGRFTLHLDDGAVARSDDAAFQVEVWRLGLNHWSPVALRVTGTVLETPPVAISEPEGATQATPGDGARHLALAPISNSRSEPLAFRLTLLRPGEARLELFDLQGRRVDGRRVVGLAGGGSESRSLARALPLASTGRASRRVGSR